jgi:Spy/CpxP family protein refolding chaperone
MMLSRICHLTAAGVLLSLAVVQGAESGQQTTPRGWWRNESIVRDLGLTAEQTARLNAIFETTMPELRQDREELERLEAKLSRMILDERMDEASLAVQIDRVETARANGNKTRSLMLTRMYRVLTREQRTRFDQLSKEWAASARPPFPPPSAFPPSPKPGASPQSKPAPSDSQRRPG